MSNEVNMLMQYQRIGEGGGGEFTQERILYLC